MKNQYRKGLDHHTHRLEKRTHGRRESEKKKIGKFYKHLKVQLKAKSFNIKDPIRILRFLRDLQDTLNNNSIK